MMVMKVNDSWKMRHPLNLQGKTKQELIENTIREEISKELINIGNRSTQKAYDDGYYRAIYLLNEVL